MRKIRRSREKWREEAPPTGAQQGKAATKGHPAVGGSGAVETSSAGRRLGERRGGVFSNFIVSQPLKASPEGL